VKDEVEIYKRQFARHRLPGKAIAPHALEVASLWAVLTRIEDPTHPNLTLLQKSRLYDGEEVQGFTRDQVHEIKDKDHWTLHFLTPSPDGKDQEVGTIEYTRRT
jgi:serine protein kinase